MLVSNGDNGFILLFLSLFQMVCEDLCEVTTRTDGPVRYLEIAHLPDINTVLLEV